MKTRDRLLMFCRAAVIMAFLMIAGGTVYASGTGDVVVVRLSSLAFSPPEIKVRPGTTVRWVNDDPFPHDVTSGRVVEGRKARQVKKSRLPDGKFHSGAYGTGEVFEHVFTEEGTYPYFCTIHPIMRGLVRVVR